MKKVEKKIDPFKFLRKKIPPPGHVIGLKKHERRRNRRDGRNIVFEGIEEYEKTKTQNI